MKSDSGLCRQFCSSTGLLIVLMSLSSLSLAQDSSELLNQKFKQAFKDVTNRITAIANVVYPDSSTQKAIKAHLDSVSNVELTKILTYSDSITPQQVRQDILNQLGTFGSKYKKLELTSGLPFYEVIELKLKHDWLPDEIPENEESRWFWIGLGVSVFIGLLVGFMGRMYYEKRKAMQTEKEWVITNIDKKDYNELLTQIKNITGKEIILTEPDRITIKEAIELLKNYQNNKSNDNRSLLELVKEAPQSEQYSIKEYLEEKAQKEKKDDNQAENDKNAMYHQLPNVRKEYFYFGSAGVNIEGKALFDSQDAKSKNADRVFYELIVQHNNPEKAEVKLIETFLDDNFNSFVDLTVQRVCTIKNTRSTNHTKIRTATSGKAEKIEGDWVVTEKVIVEYV